MEIVPFEPRYARGAAELVVGIQTLEFGVPVTLEQQPDLRDVPAHYQRGSGGFWVALDGERVVGTIGLLPFEAGRVALRKMFVAPDFRGPSGTARKLLATALAHAREQKLIDIYLGTIDRFLAARKFYEREGFRPIPPEELPEAFPRMPVDTHFFHLPLGPRPPELARGGGLF